MSYRLLDKFRDTFEGQPYLHRRSNLGDLIALELFEDLIELGGSASGALTERVAERSRVVNRANRRRGVVARRGDGTFGERVPSAEAVMEDGYAVARGQLATVEIGIEVKILGKAMLKQIGRVASDLGEQVEQFRRGGGNPICVGIVGINSASQYVSFEGDRSYPTDGTKYKHPSQEAEAIERRLMGNARPHFDEFVILRFRATNLEPFPFEWVDPSATEDDYAASLVRISRAYDERFSR